MSADPIMADFDRLKNVCQEMSRKKILIGIVGDVDSDVLKIAHAHEYGDGRLPERSFLRASFDADQAVLNSIVSGALNRMLSGQAAPDGTADSIGAQSAQLVQNYIDSNRVRPQSDFSKKTQHTTLYETGTHIRDRIAYKVVSRE